MGALTAPVGTLSAASHRPSTLRLRLGTARIRSATRSAERPTELGDAPPRFCVLAETFDPSLRARQSTARAIVSVAIRLFLNGETFDPETTRLVGVAFETARAAVNRPADLTDEMIAKKIIELAKAGERRNRAPPSAWWTARATTVDAFPSRQAEP